MKRLILGLLIAGACEGQTTGQNVVTLPLVQAATITNTTTYTCNSGGISSPCANIAGSSLQNIGQSSHTVLVTCTGATSVYTVTGEIDGSIDGVTWFIIGPNVNVTNVVGQASTTILGFQTYPYLRTVVRVNPGGNSSLVVNLTYVGNSTPSRNLIEMVSNNAIMSNIASTGTSPSTTPFSMVGNAATNKTLSLYGFIIGVPSTVTNILIGCSSDGTVAGIATTALNVPNSTAQTIVLPMSLRAYVSCPGGYSLIGQVTGSGTYSWTGQIRAE